MEQWIAFFQDRWLLIVIVLLAVWLIAVVVKALVKWVLIAAILAGLLFYGANYIGEWKETGGAVFQEMKDSVKAEALKLLSGGKTQFTRHEDGTFVISRSDVRLEGAVGSEEVKLYYKQYYITLQADETVRELIEQARRQSD